MAARWSEQTNREHGTFHRTTDQVSSMNLRHKNRGRTLLLSKRELIDITTKCNMWNLFGCWFKPTNYKKNKNFLKQWGKLSMDWVLCDNKTVFDNFVSCGDSLWVIWEIFHILSDKYQTLREWNDMIFALK